MPTFVLYIDFQKAFDLVNRDLLAYRFIKTGINGKLYHAICSLYSVPESCVRVNEFLTNCFFNSLWCQAR